MTDATTPEQPRTAAGRALLADWDEEEQGEIASRILAIEALAAAPAVASGGLRGDDWILRDLDTIIGQLRENGHADWPDWLTRIRAALASDAGSVGALDVRRAFMVLTRLQDSEVDEFAAKLIEADARTVTPWLDLAIEAEAAAAERAARPAVASEAIELLRALADQFCNCTPHRMARAWLGYPAPIVPEDDRPTTPVGKWGP